MGLDGFLKQVADMTQRNLAHCRTQIPLTTIRREAEETPFHADFMKAVTQTSPEQVGIIAEIKKASPSKGDIRPDLDPEKFARAYEKGGACAVSVLTEPHFFKGSMADLEAVCAATDLPVLRKEFIISDYQIYETKRAGADAVLLITALLSKDQLTDYILLARELNMAPLVEIHSEKELEKALYCGAAVVDVNNRNLCTLETDLTVSKRVGPIIPKEITAIEASGITSRQDIENGIACGFHNFLVGEHIVTAKDQAACIRSLLKPGKTDMSAENKSMIKICGIRDLKTALDCARMGADAIGLVFFPESPRHVTPETARQITRALPGHILTTGVFVDTPPDTIMETVRRCGISAVQLHGSESPELVSALKKNHLTIIKTLFTARPPFLDQAAIYSHADFLLVECGKGTLPGGNAETWDYAIGPALETGTPVIIAGGLTPGNVARALMNSRAAGVDVSSGVECYPGQKDIDRIRAFISNARS